MARRNSDPTLGSDKARVRVLFAEVDGNNESVQEALRTMVSAMNRSVRVLPAKANGETPALTQGLSTDSIEEVSEEDDDTDQPSPGEVNGVRKPRGSGQKTDRNAGIALVHDLNFRPTGQQPLREFFAEKAPSNDMEETLLVVYYMQHVMKLSKIGLGHVRTALNDEGKGIPLDLRQTVRNMRGKKAWVNYTELDNITTGTAGENHVLHDMGKKSTAS